jgi:hypothetical protein
MLEQRGLFGPLAGRPRLVLQNHSGSSPRTRTLKSQSLVAAERMYAMDVYETQLKTGITRTPEFERNRSGAMIVQITSWPAARLLSPCVRAAFGDGILSGIARTAIVTAYGMGFVMTVLRADDRPRQLISFAIPFAFTALLALWTSWGYGLMMLFAPDWPLWHNEHAVSWRVRLVCAALLSWFCYIMLSIATGAIIWAAPWAALLPLPAAILQYVLRHIARRQPRLRDQRG